MYPTHDRKQFNGLVVEFQFGHISRPLDQIHVQESNPGRRRQIRVLYQLRYDPANFSYFGGSSHRRQVAHPPPAPFFKDNRWSVKNMK